MSSDNTLDKFVFKSGMSNVHTEVVGTIESHNMILTFCTN